MPLARYYFLIFTKGTREFVAVEAADRRYLYLPPKDDCYIDAILKALEEEKMEDLSRLQEQEEPPRFFHNDLHDLESLWWIAIWKILNYSIQSATRFSSIDIRERVKQRELARNLLFPPSDETLKRTLFMQTGTHFRHYFAWLRWNALKGALDSIRRTLVDVYAKFEASFPDIETRIFDGIHALLCCLFLRCRDCIREETLRANRIPTRSCQLVSREVTSAQAPLQNLEPGALEQPSGQEKGRKARCHLAPGVVCENCIPKPEKRKHDNTDDFSSLRPRRRAR